MGAVTVNPVQAQTYYLNVNANPITFGGKTKIDVSGKEFKAGVFGGSATAWTVTNHGKIHGAIGVDLASSGSELTNAGTISAISKNPETQTYGVWLQAGGTVDNLSRGKIGGDLAGVSLVGAGAVTNAGAISGKIGVRLGDGGAVNNQSGGTISGVAIYGGVGHVKNTGTIGSVGGFGVAFQGVGGTVDNLGGGTISGVDAIGDAAVDVTNAGAITAGVDLGGGGAVDNLGGGTISVVVLSGGVGTVTNSGTISAPGGGFGVMFQDGGDTVDNLSGGKISGVDAIGAVDVTNAGAISGAVGVDLVGGGAVNNQGDGTISSVVISGGVGHVKNTGTIGSLGGSGVMFQGVGGTVDNLGGGTISGVDAIGDAAVDVTNAGAIKAGVDLDGGGTVHNLGGGMISGGTVGVGVLMGTGAGTVTNAGTIIGTGVGVDIEVGTGAVKNTGTISGANSGVDLQSGGSVHNLSGGKISGGVIVGAGTGAVENAGTISGANLGVLLESGGSIHNLSGGKISGYTGVLIGAGTGTVTNAGTIIGTGASSFGVDIDGDSRTLRNAGAISGGSIGVNLVGDGMVDNLSGGTIGGDLAGVNLLGAVGAVTNHSRGTISGVVISGVGTVTNAGTISGGGVVLKSGGTVNNLSGAKISGVESIDDAAYVTNAGTISGIMAGVELIGTVDNLSGGMISGDFGVIGDGTVTNAGTIIGTGASTAGVYLPIGGTVDNLSGGTISGGSGGGVFIKGGAGAVTNAGAISGATVSVDFEGPGANTLTLETGSTLTGAAVGSDATGATNALVLEGEGAANNDFNGFNTLTVEASGVWKLGGDSAIGATNLSTGALKVKGDLTTSLTQSVGTTLSIASGGELTTIGTTTVSDVTVDGTADWDNDGKATQSGGNVVVGHASSAAALLDNAATGTYDIADDSGIGLGASALSQIINAGLFEKTGGTGTSTITPEIDTTGTIAVTSGTLDLQGAVTGKGTDEVSGASLEFGSTVAKTQTVDFTGGPSAVELIDPTGFTGKFENFASMDTVDLAGDWVFSGFSEKSGGTLGTLKLAKGATELSLKFIGDYTASDFTITPGTTTVIGHA
jgi:hypothetical protein